MPFESEVYGLVALMELQASRMKARVAPGGEPILLLDQDRGAWDHLLIQRGLKALARAETLAERPEPYALQAAIAACHARAGAPDQTDWRRIASLYHALSEVVPTPVVALNQTVAVGMASGRRRAGPDRPAPRRAVAANVSSAPKRSWRSVPTARPRGRSARRVRTGGGDGGEFAGSNPVARPGRRVRSGRGFDNRALVPLDGSMNIAIRACAALAAIALLAVTPAAPPLPPGLTPQLMKMMMTLPKGPVPAIMPPGTQAVSGCIPTMGYHYAKPKDWPFGPIYGFYNGKPTFTEGMVDQKMFASGKNWRRSWCRCRLSHRSRGYLVRITGIPAT